MRFDIGRGNLLNKSGFGFDLDGGHDSGPKTVVRAARDPVRLPEEPAITELLKKSLCHVFLGYNCFVVTNVYQTSREVPYGASSDEWRQVCGELLEDAMARNDE